MVMAGTKVRAPCYREEPLQRNVLQLGMTRRIAVHMALAFAHQKRQLAGPPLEVGKQKQV